MSAVLNPIVSEFQTEEEAAGYDRWLRAKVEASLKQADSRSTPRHTSDEVTRRVDETIKATQARNATGRLA